MPPPTQKEPQWAFLLSDHRATPPLPWGVQQVSAPFLTCAELSAEAAASLYPCRMVALIAETPRAARPASSPAYREARTTAAPRGQTSSTSAPGNPARPALPFSEWDQSLDVISLCEVARAFSKFSASQYLCCRESGQKGANWPVKT